ncbi:Uncharacterised protein [Mycobacteroides abscessus subsp. abscessus]|nr:Uncharacterised protein [Mycobacteroides abscessus subsp. abscessus]SKV96383.1 Uncharacterised protein [Mycobacteroides abscessus subsp. abscessus]
MPLPRNLLRASTNAVGTPKITLSGTTIATTSRERLNAEIAAGVEMYSQNWTRPGAKARHRMSPRGTISSTAT